MQISKYGDDKQWIYFAWPNGRQTCLAQLYSIELVVGAE